MERPVRVLLVGGSAFYTSLLRDALSPDAGYETSLAPLDRRAIVERIYRQRPHVIVVAESRRGLKSHLLLAELRAGFPVPVLVFDVDTPGGRGLAGWDERLRRAIERAVAPRPGAAAVPRLAAQGWRTARGAVVVAASTGGPRALVEVVGKLPGSLPVALLIVQHMPGSFADALAGRLTAASSLPVRPAEDGEPILAARGYLARGGTHLLVEGVGRGAGRVALLEAPAMVGVRPSADLAMGSASEVYGARTIGVVLSGMGRDGADGVAAIKGRGGRVLVEAPESAAAPGMPRAALATGVVDAVLPAGEIPHAIQQMLDGFR